MFVADVCGGRFNGIVLFLLHCDANCVCGLPERPFLNGAAGLKIGLGPSFQNELAQTADESDHTLNSRKMGTQNAESL